MIPDKMTYGELRKRRNRLEADITLLLERFRDDTGATVTSISFGPFNYTNDLGGSGTTGGDLDVLVHHAQ